jgi:hypothetical protein
VRTFESADARKALLDCEKPEQMWKTLTKLTRETIPSFPRALGGRALPLAQLLSLETPRM